MYKNRGRLVHSANHPYYPLFLSFDAWFLYLKQASWSCLYICRSISCTLGLV